MITEKEQLEAEISERDARIAELEAIVPIESELRAKAEQATTELERELAALKAQQPSAGVVLPEPLRRGDEGGSGEYGAAMIRGFNACLREVARLNPCRAQTVPDGYVPVPVEPTEIMQDAGCAAMPTVDCHPYDAGMVYKAMLAAAPSAKKESGDE